MLMNGGRARNHPTGRPLRSDSGFRTGFGHQFLRSGVSTSPVLDRRGRQAAIDAHPWPRSGLSWQSGWWEFLFLFWILRPDLSDDLRIFSTRVFRFRLSPLLDLEHPVISKIEPMKQLHVLFKREYFAQRDLVETVLLVFPLIPFNYAGSLSSRTACYEKREQDDRCRIRQLRIVSCSVPRVISSETSIVRSNGSSRFAPPTHLILSV